MKKSGLVFQKQRIIVLLAVLLLVFLSSCGGQVNTTIDHYTGSEGIVVEFIENNPPDTIYSDSDFYVYIDTKNKGAFSLTEDDKGILYLYFDDFYLTLRNEGEERGLSRDIVLRGKSFEFPEGEHTQFGFPLSTKKIIGQRENPETSIFASVCYPYKTQLKATVCFDASPYNIQQIKKPCNRENIKFNSGGQGAPVVVSSIELMATVENDFARPSFLIRIENAQTGIVLNTDETHSYEYVCGELFSSASRDLGRDYFNKISIDAKISAEIPLECKPQPLTLRPEGAIVMCTIPDDFFEENKGQVFSTPLTIDLDYAYLDTITKTLNIERTIY